MPPRDPAPSRHAVQSRVTPLGTDVLFYHLRDSRLPDYSTAEYGSAYPDSQRFPDHKLVFITPADESGWTRWYYAADRETQDLYNFEVGSFDLGGITMDAVVRTYIEPRSEADIVLPTIGTTLANREPTTLWATIGSEGDWLLADATIKRIDQQELDSLYVTHTRTFVARITSLGRKYDSRMKGTFHTTRILYYRGELVGGVPIETLFANPSAGYWGMPRVGFFREGEQVDQNWFVVLERETIGLDGTTGGSLGRDGISRSLEGTPYSIDKQVASIDGAPGITSDDLQFLTSIRAEEEEDGSWRLVRSTTTPIAGVIDLEVSHKPGYRVETSQQAVTAPTNPTDVASYSRSVSARTPDGTAAVYRESISRAYAELRAVGTEKDERPMVSISTLERYDTSQLVTTPTGSSSIAYTDPSLTIYSVKEVASVGKERTIGTNKQFEIGYVVNRTDRYSLSNSLSGTEMGMVDIAYDDGATVVYKVTDETLTARPGEIAKEKETRPMVKLTTTKSVATTPEVGDGNESTRLVKTDGNVKIYEKQIVAAQGRERDIGTTKNYRLGYVDLSDESYSLNNNLATKTGSVDIAYDDGEVVVYKKSEGRIEADPVEAGKEKEVRPGVRLETTKRFDTSNQVSTASGSSRLAASDGSVKVYELSEVRPTANNVTAGTSKDARLGYTIETTERYDTNNNVATATGRSTISFTDGQFTSYKVEEERVTARPVQFVSGKKVTPLVKRAVTTKIGADAEGTNTNWESQIAYTNGTEKIYRVEQTEITAQPQRVYYGTARAAVPPVLRQINSYPIATRTGEDKWVIVPIIEEGYTGTFQTRVTEYFTKTTPNEVPAQTVFKPVQLVFQGARKTFSIEATLHPSWTEQETIGTEDPKFEPQTITVTYPPTDPPDVPRGFVPWTTEVEPYEDGYIVRKTEIRFRQ